MTDKSGTQYVFGTDDAHRRWYREQSGSNWVRRYYKLDLAYTQDVFGNRVDYTYWQQHFNDPDCGTAPQCDYIMAAYPEDISYNYDGTQAQAQVHFNVAWDNDNAALGRVPAVQVRNDIPYNVTDSQCPSGSRDYKAPKVMEIRKLASVETKVFDAGAWQLAKKYDLSYTTNPFTWLGYGSPYGNFCPPQPFTGDNTLDSISVKGRDGASQLYQSSYTYAEKHHAYDDDPNLTPISDDVWGYDWPHLTVANNGFGGSVAFTYTQQGNGCTCLHWTHNAVTTETKSAGASQPDIVTSYAYNGPYEWDKPDPYHPSVIDQFGSENRGYSQVTETDASGNKVIHSYYAQGATWNDEIRHGLEYQTVWQDSGSVQWQKAVTTWSIRNVANLLLGQYYVNFVYAGQKDSYLRDNTRMETQNTFDSYGNVTSVLDWPDYPTSGARVTTNTPYHTNATAWIFKPKYEEKVDPENANAQLSLTNFYYDGSNSRDSAPSEGRLTATSTKLNATDYTSTYFVYDIYGNQVQASVPTSTRPESQGGGGSLIGSVQVFARAARVTTNDANNVRLMIRSGGVDAQSTVKTLSTTWGYVSETWATDPATGAAWTPAAVNGLQAGVRNAMGGSGGGGVGVTQIYVVLSGNGEILRPMGNGRYLEWGELFGSGTTHWDRVEEVTPDDTGSYIMDNTWNGTERDTFQLADSSQSYGWIPAGVGHSQTAYDTSHRVYPISQTDALGHVTTTAYDYVIGRPTTITAPTGQVTEIRYDTFGRTIKGWDNLDSETYPSVQFTYNWGAVPNRTLTETRAQHGTAAVMRSASCMDGFGREVESRQYYLIYLANSVRTDYDSRGFKATQAQPVSVGTSVVCPSTPVSVTTRDRTTFTYDPLGNAIKTTFLRANQTTGPYRQADYNGKTTTLWDERIVKTTQVRSLTARTLTVNEPASVIETLRPNGQGDYSEWANASPSVPHWQNVDEATADDGASQYNDQVANRRDTQTYPGATGGATAGPSAVIFHFRWQHQNGSVPTPAGPEMWALFRQGFVDTRGPSYQSTNAGGWRDESWVMTVNPKTGLPWGRFEVAEGFEFGFEISPTTGAWPWITQTWVEVVWPSSGTSPSSVYRYGKLGQLTGVTDAAGNVTSVTYDLGGRKTAMTDPDMGSWTYGYNAASSLTSQTDARSITTTLGYDTLERLTSKSYSNGDPSVSFLYDSYPDTTLCPQGNTAIGMMTRMTDGAGAQYGCFDTRGRAVTARRTVDGQNYDMTSTFDALDQPLDVTYPDSEVVRNTRYNQGQLASVSSVTYGETFASTIYYKPTHQIDTFVLGSTGPTTTYAYDYRSRMANVTTGTARNMTLTYDDAGNVRGQTDNTTGEAVSYTYDALNRLTGATGFTGGTTAAYSYNAIGNLLTKQEGPSSLTLTYPATGQPRPHAVTSTTGTQTLTLGYDANGNLASQGASTYTFDAENRLKTRTVTGGTASYTYDGTGTLLKRTNADGSWTVYIGGVYEKNSDGTLRKYYGAAGQTVAMRSVPSGGGAGTLFYMLQDHLSSTVEVLDSSFATYAEMKYYPFGATRSTTGSSPTDKLYTGQQQEPGDSALELYNYDARFYSTTLGRFVSVDPLVASGDPQDLNPYTYVLNNPMRLVDPTGMRRTDEIEADEDAYHVARAVASGCDTGCQWTRAADAFRAASWIAAARAFQEAAAARAWVATVAQPTAASAAITQAAPSSGSGGGGWNPWGKLIGGVGSVVAVGESAVVGGSTAIADCVSSLACAGRSALAAAGPAAVPIGLGIVGGLLAPCDSYKCTTMQAKDVRPDVTLAGGRGGGRVKDLKGPPNSVVKGANGRVYVTDEEGRVVRDITRDRVKPVVPGLGFGKKQPPTVEEKGWIDQLWGK